MLASLASPVSWSLFAAGMGVVFLVARSEFRSQSRVRPDEISNPLRSAITSVLLFALLRALFLPDTKFLMGLDEYCRVHFGLLWQRAPFFATQDHIWLPGQFYVLGSMNALIGDASWAVHFTSLLGAAATVALAARLGVTLGGCSPAGLLAGVLVGAHWIVLWASANPISEIFLWPALLGGIDSWIKGWRQSKLGDQAGASRSFLVSALWIGVATLFRYEAWYAGVVLGGFLGVRWICLWHRKAGSKSVSMTFAAALVVAAGPLAWILHAWRVTGSPLVSVDRTRALNVIGDPLYTEKLASFAAYPRLLLQDHKEFLGLVIAAGAASLFGNLRWVRPAVVALALLLLVSMVAAAFGGIGSHLRGRFPLFLLLPGLCIAGALLARAWGEPAPRGARALQATVVGLVTAIVLASAARAALRYPSGTGADAHLLGMMARLEREEDRRPTTPPEQRILRTDRKLFILHRGHDIAWWMARYHSGHPERIVPVVSEVQLATHLDSSPPGTTALIRRPIPESILESPNLRLFEIQGPYELWEVVRGPH